MTSSAAFSAQALLRERVRRHLRPSISGRWTWKHRSAMACRPPSVSPLASPPPKSGTAKATGTAVDPPRCPKTGRVAIGKVLARQQHPKWYGNASRVRRDLHANKDRFPTCDQVSSAFPTPGLPPAPPECYGKMENVAQHLYQWDPNTTMATHFVPDRHTMMINGRPMQASCRSASRWFYGVAALQAEPSAACKASAP